MTSTQLPIPYGPYNDVMVDLVDVGSRQFRRFDNRFAACAAAIADGEVRGARAHLPHARMAGSVLCVSGYASVKIWG